MERIADIGEGIYTVPDIARVFDIPTHKINHWIKEYWDKRLLVDFDQTYSWTDGKARAVNFHTLIELFVYLQLYEAGVSTRSVLKAHMELSEQFNTAFPFANNKIVAGLRADGKKISFETHQGFIYTLDGTKQFKLEFYREFLKKIDFGDDDLARRFWPHGKESSIVLDPEHSFGQPVIDGTNITADSINLMYKAGESVHFIAHLYHLSDKEVNDAIEFCNAA